MTMLTYYSHDILQYYYYVHVEVGVIHFGVINVVVLDCFVLLTVETVDVVPKLSAATDVACRYWPFIDDAIFMSFSVLPSNGGCKLVGLLATVFICTTLATADDKDIKLPLYITGTVALLISPI